MATPRSSSNSARARRAPAQPVTPAPATPRQPAPSGVGVRGAVQAFNAADPFGAVPTTAPISPTKKGKGKEREAVEIENLDTLASFKVLEKVLEQEAGLIEANVRQLVIDRYVEAMAENGKKPDSFVGVGEHSSASCEIRRRGSNMPLDEETALALQGRGISVEKKVKVPSRFVINPEIPQDALQRLAELVKTDPVLSQHTVVMKQPEEYTWTTSETTLDALAQTKDAEFILDQLERLATFAVGKFKIDGVDIEAATGQTDEEGHKIKAVTPGAKARAIKHLTRIGVLPE